MGVVGRGWACGDAQIIGDYENRLIHRFDLSFKRLQVYPPLRWPWDALQYYHAAVGALAFDDFLDVDWGLWDW